MRDDEDRTVSQARTPGHARLARIRGSMPSPSELRRGETPWDGLSREDLVFLLASHHAVLRDVDRILEVPFGAGRRERDAVAACRAALGHVFPDYMGGPHDERIAYGGTEPEGGGPTEWERFDDGFGMFRDLLAFGSPSCRWWACLTCGVSQGRREGVPPQSLLNVRCDEGRGCRFEEASWEGLRAEHGTAVD